MWLASYTQRSVVDLFLVCGKRSVFRSGKKKRTAWLFLPPRITLVTKFYVFATGLKVGQEGFLLGATAEKFEGIEI